MREPIVFHSNEIPYEVKKKLDNVGVVEISIMILSLFITRRIMGFRLLAIFQLGVKI